MRSALAALVVWSLLAAVVLCGSPAFAATPITWWSTEGQQAFASPQESCDTYQRGVTGEKGVINQIFANGNYQCAWLNPNTQAVVTSQGAVTRGVERCAGGADTVVNHQCAEPVACPYGQMYTNGVCGPICPTGQHYGRTSLTPLEVSSCMDNCPANTFDTTAPGKLSVCAPTPPKDTEAPVKKTCDAGFNIVGFNGDGSAQCVPKPVPPDPCPKGTHNISADIASPNCTSDTPAKENNATSAPTANPDGSTTKTKTETVTNPNGTTETRTTVTTTKPDGSETSTVTYSGTGNGSATAGGSGTGTGSNGGGGGGSGTGSGSGDKGDGVTGGPDTFFDKKDKTFSGSITAFKTAVVGAPIVSGANTFLKGTVSSGGCFNGVVSIPFLKTSVDFAQYLCGGNVSQVLQVMAIGLMIGAAFVAFRMGFL